MFKQLFGHPSRKSITMAFLNALLHRTGDDRIIDVQFENTELSERCQALLRSIVSTLTKHEKNVWDSLCLLLAGETLDRVLSTT